MAKQLYDERTDLEMPPAELLRPIREYVGKSDDTGFAGIREPSVPEPVGVMAASNSGRSALYISRPFCREEEHRR